ncbi:transketolase family protein [Microbacterium sp. SSM24]|uniref:transketolase family protein n=1 Tax=Microbacterium sp. SSM24 TaxID=2991714 RepID=UPI002225FC60|nr:transketolase C-terminal domain-containing protein [Microbacterium sp. SSM24]MCW3492705.1 transketolase family protein [Microbacterium sp. SSM24]
MKAQRDVWGDTLVEIGAEDPSIVVVDGDLANSTKADKFAEAFPDRFVEVGIAEQNMVGIAFGLTTAGFRPWLSTFGVFLTHRALDPIRMLVSQTHAPVRIAGSYSGLLNGSSGKTHQDIEDLAIMRAMPNMTVLAPADEVEIAEMTRWASAHDGPVYVRIARDAVPAVLPENYQFRLGEVVTLHPGGVVALVSTGVQSSRVNEAAAILSESGIHVRVIHVPTIKPLDVHSLLAAVDGARLVITIEEHTTIGGLGGLISETLSELEGAPRVARLGLEDQWSESGPNDFLLDKYGLSPERVAEQVRGYLNSPVTLVAGGRA